MDNYVYLAWQDQSARSWHVIGRLLRTSEGYEFRYTKGVKNIPSFSALSNMPEQQGVYTSPELFSLFKNRLMPKTRPDYPDYIRWMGIEKGSEDELQALAISGGERETDFFRIISVPKKVDDHYTFKFFVNGLSHMDDNAKARVMAFSTGTTLFLADDFQNEKDGLAILLRTDEPPCLIGYVPAYFAKVIHKMRHESGPNSIRVHVSQLNQDAPVQMRLLCEFTLTAFKGSWEEHEDEFKLIE